MCELFGSGIDARTGHVLPTPTFADVAEAARASNLGMAAFKKHALPEGMNGENIAESGWAIVFPAETPQNVRDALAPLVEHRRARAEALTHKLQWLPADNTARNWLKRHFADVTVDPRRVPYHLLLIGPPTEIPFHAQYALDLNRSVGRIDFGDDADAYAAYAHAVVAAETAPPRRKEIAFWATAHDRSTRLSHNQFAVPLADGEAGANEAWRKAAATVHGFATTRKLAEKASPQALVDILADAPGIVVTASHGMAVEKTDPRQLDRQGGLLGHGWKGFGPPGDDLIVHADDLDTANVRGSIVLILACFGGGTPGQDDFPWPAAFPATQERYFRGEPFVAALPKRLLSHPNGAALAVLAHVDRAWSYSFESLHNSARVGPFRTFLAKTMQGQPVGHAKAAIHARHATLGAELAGLIAPGEPPGDGREIAERWMEFRDARNFILLGDPAACLRV